MKNQIGEVFLVPLDLLCTSPPGLALVAARGCGLMLEPQPVSPSHLGHSHAALPGLSTPAPSVGVVSGGPFFFLVLFSLSPLLLVSELKVWKNIKEKCRFPINTSLLGKGH